MGETMYHKSNAGLELRCGKKNYKMESINQLVQYICENYSKPLTLETISEKMSMNPIYVSKLFKNIVGVSPIQYLIQVRLQNAKQLLETERILSISEVAKRVGYDDVCHFSKSFKKHFGYPPSYIDISH